MAMTLIKSTTLASDTSSISFNSIPTSGKGLFFTYRGKTNVTSGTGEWFWVRLNGVSSNYRYGGLGSNAAGVSWDDYSSQTSCRIGFFPSVSYNGDQNISTAGYGYIVNPFTSGSVRRGVWANGGHANDNTAGASFFYQQVGELQTTPITSLTFGLDSGSFKAGTTISLYSIGN